MIRNVLPPLAVVAAITLPLFPGKAETPLQLKSLSLDLPTGDLMFPTGPGSDAANNNCLACHSAGMVLNQPALSQAQWRAEVEKMRMAYKAPVDEKDVDAIVNYLVSIGGTN